MHYLVYLLGIACLDAGVDVHKCDSRGDTDEIASEKQ